MLEEIIHLSNYQFSFFVIPHICIALLIIIIGLLITAHERFSLASNLIFINCLLLAAWGFLNAFIMTSKDAAISRQLSKYSCALISYIPVLLFQFSLLALYKYKKYKKLVISLYIFATFFVFFILQSNVFLNESVRYSWGYYTNFSVYSFIWFSFLVFVEFLIVYFLWKDYLSRNSGDGSKKNNTMKIRAKLLLIGFCIGNLSFIDALPGFGISIIPLGFISIFVFILITAYVAWKYRLNDITPEFASGKILETMDEALIVLDNDWNIRVINPAVKTLFGEKLAGSLGKRIDEFFSDELFVCHLKYYLKNLDRKQMEFIYRDNRGETILQLTPSIMKSKNDRIIAYICIFEDISDKKQEDVKKEKLILKLEKALSEVKTLQGLIPICAHCKRLRDEKGYWDEIENYILSHSQAELSHGLCPDCIKEYYPDFYKHKMMDKKE